MFESAFGAVCTVQDQTEEITSTLLKQMTWVPEESLKSINEAVDMYKKARENYKKSVENGFERLEELFAG
jgi:hypothetical protein